MRILRICFLAVAVIWVSGSCNYRQDPEPLGKEELKSISPANFDYSRVRPGDFILKRGKGPVSKMITDNFKEEIPISHCGIIVMDGDSLAIIHSVTREYGDQDGVQRIDLSRFLLDCAAGYLYVVRFESEPDLNEQMALRAWHYALNKVPFDQEVKNEDKEKMSCTELIYWCMKDVYRKDYFNRISIGDKTFLGFSGLMNKEHFKTIAHY